MAATANQADSIFWTALEKSTVEERAAYLDRACDGNEVLRGLIDEMLAAYPKVGGFLEQPAAGVEPPLRQPAEGPGTQIGPYKLLEQIGEGGMGVVFMAQQLAPVKRKVALKLIKAGMDTKQVIARFEAERQALALMDHPNIARVLDAGTTGEAGRPYFVMELVRGVPITEYCEREQLETRQRLGLFLDVCRAVHHAHQKGIIHRDLKPNNVLVTMHDGVPVVKVIDFGVAKALNQELTERTLFTQFAQMIGTPLYMSPEQAEMSGLDVDTRSDIYSLGVLLYELLTGTTPFDKDTLGAAGFDEMRRIIREVEPETVSARLARTRKTGTRDSGLGAEGRSSKPLSLVPNPEPRIPRLTELDWIAMKAMDKDRSRRYESASSLAADVQRYLNDESVHACPPSALYRFRKFARRNKRALAMLATIAVALLASVVALTVAYLQTSVAYQKVNEKQHQTQEALDRERQALYYHRIALANSSFWADNDVGQAERLLGECPEEFRHWEWHYLKRLCHTDVLTLPHRFPVLCLAYSPDGRRLATASRNLVSIWDAQTGQQLSSLRHTGVVSSLAFSPDGKHLASASDDQTVKLWDSQSSSEIRTLRGHQGPVHSVAFNPASGLLASAGQDQTVMVWDTATGKQITTLEGHTGSVRAVAFSPDGQCLASASEDKTVRIWDATNYQHLLTLQGHTSYVLCVAFHPQGQLVVTGGYDWTPRIWDVATGQVIHALDGHKHHVSSVAFSADGHTLATSSYDQTKLWDVASGRQLNTLRGHTHWVQQVDFGPGGMLASASHDRTAKIWNPKASPAAQTISMPSGEVHHAAFSPDGQRLATAGGDNEVRIWDATTGKELQVLTGHTWRVWDVAFSPDGKLLASAGGRRGDPDPADVKLWDATTGSELFTLRGHTRTVRKVAFSPDGRRLASASHDQMVKLWDVATGKELYTIDAHGGEAHSVAFSPSGRQLASASQDKTVKLWDAATGQLLRTLSVHDQRVFDVGFSPDGQRLAAVGGSLPAYVMIWDAATGDVVHSLAVRAGPIYGLAFSPDSRRLATVSYDGSVKIWDALTGQETLSLRGHTDAVRGAAFSPDGRLLATASYDGTVKIWDATPMGNDE